LVQQLRVYVTAKAEHMRLRPYLSAIAPMYDPTTIELRNPATKS
jgi:hypothetical protein